ncbi:uncharacterized protein LTR77_001715 [Saxophila tyrrhenica]|uniref:Uncharacterized protein n=1 Tax=Saxophila tyrrhenica TaxID=1690608 RepID=A0AAV9PKW7_9PEZI|nr:hypothetical protein LTR77_001715 [Saxophila tyrrhenica]
MEVATGDITKRHLEWLADVEVGDAVLLLGAERVERRKEGLAEPQHASVDGRPVVDGNDAFQEIAASHTEAEAVDQGGVMVEETWHDEELYLVLDTTRDDNGNLVDAQLRDLYCEPYLSAASPASHSIDSIDLALPEVLDPRRKLATVRSIKDLAGGLDGKYHRIICRPDGDTVRNYVHGGKCGVRCNQGFLECQDKVTKLASAFDSAFDDYEPLCPVCVGEELVYDYHNCRDAFSLHNLGGSEIEQLHQRLNMRLEELGYTTYQYRGEDDGGPLFRDVLQDDPSELDDDE